MYIERLHVRNVRLLAEQEFSFLNADGTPRMWTVILGENGFCKSTLLQAIGLVVMGPKLGTALIQNSQRLRNIRNRQPASIDARFSSVNGSSPLDCSLRIEPDRFDLIPGEYASGAELIDEIRAHRSPDWFAVGYGVSRFQAELGEALSQDPTVHRLLSLFRPHHKMLGLHFHSAFRDKRHADLFARLLGKVLSAGGPPAERLLPGFCGLDLDLDPSKDRSPIIETNALEINFSECSLRTPASWLSDGYQAVLCWVSELLGHALLEMGEYADPSELRGIVLLDEIDLHLHPTWQRKIVPLLRSIFPKLQFIVTTHSPLVLAGFEREEIISLKLEDGQIVQDPAGIEPGVLTASEILTNFFDVSHAGRPELIEKER